MVPERVEFEVGGVGVVGDLYLPEMSETGEVLPTKPPTNNLVPGVVVAGPMTSVKEQVTGTYARALALKGYAALAIDHRHFGESGGEPRSYECYPRKLEDLHGAFECLKADARIDATQINAVGVCLGCGYMARTVAERDDVKAFAAVAGYYRDVSAMRASDPTFQDKVDAGKKARLKYELTGVLDTIPAALPPNQGDAAMTMQSTYDYYAGRMAVDNYKNEFAVMSREYFLEFDVQCAAPKLTMPFYQLHGPNAIAPKLADRFYDNVVRAPYKSKVALDSPDQTTIYDDPAIVASCADDIANFFRHANTAFV